MLKKIVNGIEVVCSPEEEAEIRAAWATSQQIKDLYEATQAYKDKRKAEYPDFRLYLDGVVKGNETQIQAYIDACLAVKAKYPKPE